MTIKKSSHQPAPIPPQAAYLIRCWREGERWRYSIEDVASRQRRRFDSVEELLAVLQVKLFDIDFYNNKEAKMSEQQMSVYPQARPFMSDEVESFLARPLIAKLCTYNEDETIHIVPIWFRYENGEFLLGTQEVTRKVRNIKRNNQVSLLVDTQEPTLQGVIVQGQAELDYDDVIPKRISIFEKYLGSEDAPGLAQRLASNWTPVIIRLKPEHIISFDYGKGFGISANPEAETTEIV